MIQTQCRNCVMDNSACEIYFDEDGVCNFCNQAQQALREIEENCQNDWALYELTDEIVYHIYNFKKPKYDVLIGLSGGIDSSYALTKLVELGLKPLCFSVDNGYNDPKADENIMRLVEGLKVPFFRYTIDLKKFAQLQMAFLKAGLKNAEIPTDHILMATTYEMASKYGIKYIISGGNVATESIMPPSWGHNARDLTHIKDVYKKMTGQKLKGLPVCSVWKWNYYRWIKGIKIINLLDYFDYNRAEAITELELRFGYQNYGDKHEENYFTRWFQNFYLFDKFGIDKRKAHYSSMINSGQMTRQDALNHLESMPIYPELGFEKKVMDYPRHRHDDFKMDKWYNRITKLVKILC